MTGDTAENYPIKGFGIGLAVKRMQNGERVARAGWNGKGMFVFLVPGSVFKVNRPPLLGIYPEGTEIKYHPHVDMKTADGQVVPWLVHRAAGAPNLGANIRHEGGIPICGWCGFALIIGGPRECCEQGRAYDSASTYALLPTGSK